jgi:SAM-dependent methyltransferase
MVAALRLVGRKISRLDVAFVPTQQAILRSYAWAVVATAAAAVSFTIIARPHHAGIVVASIAAFATAWWIGFVAIPFPSGIGIREAVLLAALRAPLGSGVVLGAAIGQRLVSIVAEATLIGGSGTHRLRSRRAAGTVREMPVDPATRHAVAATERRPLGLAPGAPEQAAGQDAKKYSTGNPVVQKLIARWATRLRAEIATLAPPGETMADIGVGEGLALERIRPDGTVVVGVEYRGDKVRCARDLLDGLHGVVGDAGMLPLRDGAVPLTTCIEVLEHLTDPEPAVRELARVAGRGCVVSVPWEPWFRLGNFARGKNVGRLGNDPEHLQFFTRRRLEKLLGRHFESVRVLPVFPWLVGVATDPRRSG